MTWKTVAIMTVVGLVSVASQASAQVCVPPPSGLVGWWPGDGTTQDLAAGNDGAWSGQVAYRPAIVEQAFAFNNASIIVPHSVALSPTNAITVEAWINRDFRWSDYDPLLAKFGEPPFGPEKGFHLAFHETRVNFSVYLAGIGWLSSYDGFEVADGVWTHVAGVYDGSEIRLYVNGALALPPYPVVGTMVPSSNPLYIGSDQDTRFHGAIDEAQVFSRALSEAEIHAQYAAGSAGQCKPHAESMPSTFWVGLKNSDDQGTQFDLRTEAFINNTLVSVTEARCITGLTRNPALAKEVSVPAGPGSAASAGDVLSVRLLTRIGTNADNTKCSGPGGSHNNATGLRLYFDSSTRPSRVTNQFTSGPFSQFFLHATGTPFLFLDGLRADRWRGQDQRFGTGQLWRR